MSACPFATSELAFRLFSGRCKVFPPKEGMLSTDLPFCRPGALLPSAPAPASALAQTHLAGGVGGTAGRRGRGWLARGHRRQRDLGSGPPVLGADRDALLWGKPQAPLLTALLEVRLEGGRCLGCVDSEQGRGTGPPTFSSGSWRGLCQSSAPWPCLGRACRGQAIFERPIPGFSS